MIDVSVKVEGLDKLDEALRTQPPQIARRILRRALKKPAEIWRDEMAMHAARLTGFLAEHIVMKISTRQDISGSAAVGPSKTLYPARIGKTRRWRGGPTRARDTAMVARFLEFGTRKMRAHPFIRQAFEAKKTAVLEAFIAEAKAAFEDVSGRTL